MKDLFPQEHHATTNRDDRPRQAGYVGRSTSAMENESPLLLFSSFPISRPPPSSISRRTFYRFGAERKLVGSSELRVVADRRFGATLYQSIGPDVFTEIVSPLTYNDGQGTTRPPSRSGLVRLYVDGVLVAQDTTNPITSVRTSSQTMIGHVASDFAGDIDEVRVFSRALTATEIAAAASGATLAVQLSHADHLAGVPFLVEGGHRSPHEVVERPVVLTIRLLGIDPASLIPRIFPLILGITLLAAVVVKPASVRKARSRSFRRWKIRRRDVSQKQ